MTIRKVEAEIECDGCGKLFDVELDAGSKLKCSDDTLAELVEDTIRGRLYMSVQGEHQLCAKCTEAVDAAFDDEALPTREQVTAILNKAAGV